MNAISVKGLAEFVHASGDLYETREGGGVRAEEGLAAHAAVQKRRKAEGGTCEVSVKQVFPVDELSLTVRGRADVVLASEHIVEELKTSRRPMLQAAAAHRAQAKLYTAMLAEDDETWIARVSYVHPDSQAITSFDEHLSSQERADFLARTVRDYGLWLLDRAAHRADLAGWCEALRFPFEQPRPYQRALAAAVARTLDEEASLLLEAPTGSGKTMGVLYPAVRQVTKRSRLWYLTSKTTGQVAAAEALRQIGGGEQNLRVSTITSKERICPVPGQPCDAAQCRYARGYYDRRHEAVRDLLARRDMHRTEVEAVAEAHTVCPFELSLDAALWADVIVGDYNYVFDPVVRLQRFAGDKDAQVLVDEAHHLSPRVASMLSVSLSRATVRDALAHTPDSIAGKLRALDRQLTTLRRTHPQSRDGTTAVDPPEGVFRACSGVVQGVGEWLDQEPSAALHPELERLLFDCARWVRAEQWQGEAAFTTLLNAEDRWHIELELACIDPAPYVSKVLSEFAGHVRFSATVSPEALYQAAHGQGDDADFARAGSPFDPSQLATYVVPDVPTYFKARERSMGDLVTTVRNVVNAKPGRYLVCFPSYAYLQRFAVAYGAEELLLQAPDLDDAGRAAFLHALAGRDSVTAAVVLGGVFSESLDFDHAPLDGVVIVGVALPPPEALREQMVRHHDSAGRDGRLVAFVQPGMAKVVQAAGRLIRSSLHRGVLVLIDGRYLEPTYRQFFPSLWQPQTVKHACLPDALLEFWNDPND